MGSIESGRRRKKIRQRFWGEGMYSFKKDSRFGVCKSMLATHYPGEDYDEDFGDLNWDEIFADDWEIYEEEEVNQKLICAMFI